MAANPKITLEALIDWLLWSIAGAVVEIAHWRGEIKHYWLAEVA
jgi:hypothetical protein